MLYLFVSIFDGVWPPLLVHCHARSVNFHPGKRFSLEGTYTWFAHAGEGPHRREPRGRVAPSYPLVLSTTTTGVSHHIGTGDGKCEFYEHIAKASASSKAFG